MPEEDSAVVADVSPNKDVPEPGVPVPGGDMAALAAELGKWRQRVPRLASALKARTEEVEALKDSLSKLRNSEDAAARAGGMKARDELIAELEAKVATLTEQLQQSQSDLHRSQLTAQSLTDDVSGWRSKWQSVTEALDAQAATAAEAEEHASAHVEALEAALATGEARARELEETAAASEREATDAVEQRNTLEEQLHSREADLEALQERCESLQTRNDKLLETTELANTQIEALGESLGQLKERLAEREVALVELGEAHEAQVRANREQQQTLTEHEQTLAEQTRALQDRQDACERLEADAAEAQRLASVARAEAEDRLAAAASEAVSLKEVIATQENALATLDETQQRTLRDAAQTQAQLTEELDRAIAERRAAQDEVVRQTELARERSEQDRLAQTERHEQELAWLMLSYEGEISVAAEAHRSRLDVVAAQLLEAEASLTRVRQEDHETQTRSDAADAQISELRGELDRARHGLADTILWAEQLEVADTAQRQALAAAQAQAAQALQDADQRADEEERLTARVSELEDALAFAEKDQQAHTRLKAQYEEVLAQQAKVEAAAAEREAEAARSRDEVAAAMAEAAAQSETVEALLAQVQDDGDTATDQEAATLDGLDHSGLGEELAEARRERDDYLMTIMTLEDDLQSLRRQVQTLRAGQALPESSAEADSEFPMLADGAAAEDSDASELRRLQTLVRERTEEANELRWQLRMHEERTEEPSADGARSPAVGDDKMLLILNQQLQRAQEENARLSAELRSLSATGLAGQGADAAANDGTVSGDDLSEIRGIGDRLLEQLIELGYRRFADIAALEPAALEAPDHPLHTHRSRIERDRWIAQARALQAQLERQEVSGQPPPLADL
ncbi:MAG: hypothetical protein AAGI15_01395 [Pseudomonadota bacterium]